MSLKTKILVGAALSALLIAYIYMASMDKKSALVGSETQSLPPVVSLVKAAAGPIEGAVTLTGSIVAREEILVGAEADGLRIVKIHADEGDIVKAGDTLAELARDLIDAQIAQNVAATAQAQSQIESAQAALAEADAAAQRAQSLKDEGFVTQATLDARIAAAKTAAAQLQAAKSGLDLARAQGRELQSALKRRFLKAPVDGIIARRTASIGQIVSGMGEPMFRIIANGEIEMLADLTESDLALMAIGQPATVTTDSAQSAKGVVRIVSPEINNTTRMGRIRILLDKNSPLKIGSFARAQVFYATKTGIRVPARAITFEDSGAHVLALTESNTVKKTPVTTGIKSGESIEITSGLSDGDWIVEKAGTFLRDGDTITPKKATPEKTTADSQGAD